MIISPLEPYQSLFYRTSTRKREPEGGILEFRLGTAILASVRRALPLFAIYLTSKIIPASIGLKDWLFGGVVCASLVGSCILRSHGLPMWTDELFSFQMIQDPSLFHMLKALGDGSDGAPPLYYLLVRMWAALFSMSELSLRLFTTATVYAAFVLIWITLRRVYDFWPAALAMSVVMGTSETIRFENSNIRFYGLLFALISLALLLAVELGASERPSLRLIVANGCVQAALILCHPLGGFYSACLLTATVLADAWVFRRIRWGVAISYPAGWCILPLWLRQFAHQAAINNPHSWVPVPKFGAAIALTGSIGHFERLGCFLGVMIALSILFVRKGETAAATPDSPGLIDDPELRRRQSRILFVGFALIGMLPFIWIFSRLVPNNSLFVARYLLGVSIGWTIIMTQLSSVALPRLEWSANPGSKALKAIVVIFILSNLAFLFGRGDLDRNAMLGGADPSFGHTDLPIVCLRSHDFMPRMHYSPNADRYYYVLDRPVAVLPNNPLDASVTDYNLLAAAARNYPGLYRNHIVDVQEFLDAHPSFLVQDVPHTCWVTTRLKPDEYTITPLTASEPLATGHEGAFPLLLVEKKR